MSDYIATGALLSGDGLYRYELTRQWDHGDTLRFVMLNPSTADALQDDPTIRRCVGFAKAHGYGGIVVLNLFAWRATSPADLITALASGVDAIGPMNDRVLQKWLTREPGWFANDVVLAWGANAGHHLIAPRAEYMLRSLDDERVYSLGRTSGGHPKHPLYLPADTALESWW